MVVEVAPGIAVVVVEVSVVLVVVSGVIAEARPGSPWVAICHVPNPMRQAAIAMRPQSRRLNRRRRRWAPFIGCPRHRLRMRSPSNAGQHKHGPPRDR
jgi:hypothetical protein